MHPSCRCLSVVFAAAVLALLGAALPALANVSVSTSDGMTLTLTDSGAFSSLTVDGNTVPTLGINGGFFIVPVDGIRIDLARRTYYPGTQATGTATQVGSDIHFTTSAVQNQTFDVWLRGGLPYIKVDGTVTGNGSDHAFLVDFRLPVDADGWTWYNALPGTPDGSDAAGPIPTVQTISNNGGANWYFAEGLFWAGTHPRPSIHPYGTISKTASPAMGLTLSPLLYPPQAFVMEYNSQTGLFIQFEMGTTNKTTKHPNTAYFDFVLYKHNPAYGMRSAVQRYQSFFPTWYNRVTSGGNWHLDSTPRLTNPNPDFALKFAEGLTWTGTDSYYIDNGILTCRYVSPWSWVTNYLDFPEGVDLAAKALDIPANWWMPTLPCWWTNCPQGYRNGIYRLEVAQMDSLSNILNPDGTFFSHAGDTTAFGENFDAYRWLTNPDPEIPNTPLYTPGRNREQICEAREWYDQSATNPSGPNDKFTGLYQDCAGGFYGGWGMSHNFNPAHWPYYDYNPGIYWSADYPNFPKFAEGQVCMWQTFSNMEYVKYSYEQMRRENRVVIANIGRTFESQLQVPFVDVWGSEQAVESTTDQDIGVERSVWGPKPMSFLYGYGGGGLADAPQLKKLLPFAIYPGTYYANTGIESSRTVFAQYMPIFNQLDAALWRPITAATAADSTQILERFGPNASGEYFWVLRAINAGTATVTLKNSELGWTSNPDLTITSLLGATPSRSNDGNGNAVLSFGAITAGDDEVVKVVYNGGTPSLPKANFTASTQTPNVNVSMTFTDTSTGTPTSWYWSFGDGGVSLSQNPSHTYTAAGKYVVSLTAINATGQDTKTVDNYITALGVPIADFFGSPNTGVNTLTVKFRDKSDGTPTAWSWNFGDGYTSTAQNPTHTYTYSPPGQPRYYTVTLTASNASGSSTPCVKTDLIALLPVRAYFEATTPTFGGAPFPVTFQDLSNGTPTSWSWSFGDSGTDTVQNPTHTYNTAGWWTVSLTATNAGGSDQYTRTDYIHTVNLLSAFTADPTFGIPPLAVTFTDTSTGAPTSWSWTFGDGYTATTQNASHTYQNAGTYTASLTVDKPGYTDTSNQTIYVCTEEIFYPTSWYAPWGAVESVLSGSLSDVQTDNSVYMVISNDTSKSTNESFVSLWECDTGKHVSEVKKIIYDLDGHVNVWSSVGLLCQILKSGGGFQPGEYPTWTNTDSYWSWGTTDVAAYLNDTAGHVGLLVCAKGNCGNPNPAWSMAFDMLRFRLWVTSGGTPAPVANFSGNPTSGTAPLAVNFTDTSTNTPTSWSWDFGDSNTSTVQNPSHTYAAGTYTVSLTATNAGGSDGETKTDYISVTLPPAPVASFTSTLPTSGTGSVSVTFTDTSTNSPTSWSWTFGDSSSSTAQNPSHTYSTAGAYAVALTATNGGGNDTCTYDNYVIVRSNAGSFMMTPTSNSPAAGSTVVSGGASDLTTEDNSYLVTQCNTSDQHYSWHFLFNTGYTPAGVSALRMEQRYHTSRTDTPGSLTFFVYNPITTGWDVMGTGTSLSDRWIPFDTTDITHRMDSSGVVHYMTCGCPATGNSNNYQISYDVERMFVTVIPPVADFSGTPTTGAAPLVVSFTDTSTNSPTSWSWSFGDSNTSTVQNPSHTYAAGTYTVSLTATNAGGSDGKTKTNYITATGPPTFVAAGAVASGINAITPALPSGRATNDILLLFLETANQAISISNQNGGTWTQVANSPQSVGTAGGSNGTRLTVFWSRYNGTQGAPTTSDSGNHQLGRIIAIRGAATSGNPWDVTAGGVESTADTSGAIPGATTTVANTLVVAAIATSLPDANGTANFSAWANSDLTSVAERTDNTTNAGNGGGLGIATGVKATAGAYTTTSVTCGTATTKAMMSIAIKP